MSRYVMQCPCGCQQFDHDADYDMYICTSCNRVMYSTHIGAHLVKDRSVDYSPTCTFVKGEGNAKT